MTTPSPQPQPNDWAMEAVLFIYNNICSDDEVWDSSELTRAADVIRRHAPVPAPRANEGAVNELVEAMEMFDKVLEVHGHNWVGYLIPIPLENIRRLAKAVAAVKAGG
jgi:hypothetical protein